MYKLPQKEIISFFLLLACMASSRACFAQSYEERKIELKNETLLKKLGEYDAYLKKWASDNQVGKYIITIDCASGHHTNTFVLGILNKSNKIESFAASFYTMVDDKPVLIRVGLETFVKGDTGFSHFLQNTFWKEAIERAQENEKDHLAKYQEKIKTQSDSVKVYTKNGPKMFARKDAKPVILDPETLANLPSPKSWVLIFEGKNLINELIDRLDNQIQPNDVLEK